MLLSLLYASCVLVRQITAYQNLAVCEKYQQNKKEIKK